MIDSKTISKEKLAKLFDHTNLKADAKKKDIEALCGEGAEYRFASVMVNPAYVPLCRTLLGGTGVAIGTVVSFPLGAASLDTKLYEVQDALKNGAGEIDYVLNIGALKSGDYSYIEREMRTITTACRIKGAKVKVIFETCYLDKKEIKKVAGIARDVQPDFIKTSTGFGTGGATPEDVALMAETVGGQAKVKASGGIRTWKDCKAMLDAGAERIGTSGGIRILKEFEKRK